jgi:sulfur carrier protein ThiS
MKITVQVNDYFSRYGVSSGVLELDPRATVADLLQKLGLPQSEVGFVVRAGKILEQTDVLYDNDVVSILPFALGG